MNPSYIIQLETAYPPALYWGGGSLWVSDQTRAIHFVTLDDVNNTMIGMNQGSGLIAVALP